LGQSAAQVEAGGGDSSADGAGRGSAGMAPLISRALLVGVSVSAATTIAGFLMYVILGGGGYPPGVFPVAIGSVLSGVVAMRPFAIIDLGLMLLILTPVFRVAVGIAAFAREHDSTMVAATSYVMCMLILSFLLGKAGG
jgi:uncharacterized membrane protein